MSATELPRTKTESDRGGGGRRGAAGAEIETGTEAEADADAEAEAEGETWIPSSESPSHTVGHGRDSATSDHELNVDA
jgi:hypothetical protein